MTLYVHYRPEGGLPKQIKQRRAELSDVVAWLETEHGATRHHPPLRTNIFGHNLPVVEIQRIEQDEPGEYLVVRLPLGSEQK